MRWCLILLGLYAAQGFAETSLWRVSNGENQTYIGGTIHVLSKSDYPLPSAFYTAYKNATKLVFETDIGANQDPVFAQSMMQRMMFTDGQTLKSTLKPDVYQQLKKFSTEHGMPIAMLENMRPAMVVLTLTVMELQRLGMAGTGVDNHFFQRARADNKAVGHLETNVEQLDFIANMGKGREDDFVLYSLKDLGKIEHIMRDIKSAWRTGDHKGMEDLSLNEMRREFPKIYKNLLVDRNQNWLPRIESMLENEEVEMVLVGALHLVGKDGVIQALEAKGYRIEQL